MSCTESLPDFTSYECNFSSSPISLHPPVLGIPYSEKEGEGAAACSLGLQGSKKISERIGGAQFREQGGAWRGVALQGYSDKTKI